VEERERERERERESARERERERYCEEKILTDVSDRREVCCLICGCSP
jgi:hypothetical protein